MPLFIVWSIKSKELSPSAEREALLFCLSTPHAGACANSEAGPKGAGQDARSKREVPKRKRHPTWRLPSCARQIREPGPGFSIGHPALRKGADIGQPLLRCLNSGVHALAMSTPLRARRPDSPPQRGSKSSCAPPWSALGVHALQSRSKTPMTLDGYSDMDDVC